MLPQILLEEAGVDEASGYPRLNRVLAGPLLVVDEPDSTRTLGSPAGFVTFIRFSLRRRSQQAKGDGLDITKSRRAYEHCSWKIGLSLSASSHKTRAHSLHPQGGVEATCRRQKQGVLVENVSFTIIVL